MLTLLGIGTIAALLLLILFRVTSVLVALTLVPVAAALIGGFAGSFGTYAMDGIRGVTPVAVLLAFAVIYFGVMNDAGLFEPVISALVRLVGTDPVRIALGTAAVASVAHLDGAGASTFMVTIPAMLPLYARARMSPLALTWHHRARGRHHEHAALGRTHYPRRERAAAQRDAVVRPGDRVGPRAGGQLPGLARAA